MKKVSYLLEYARAQIGRPYWCGTFGQVANEWLYNFNKRRLPMYYTATDFPTQYGQKVHDCIGLIKGAMWCNTPNAAPVYLAAQDVTVYTMYATCTNKGKISDSGTLKEGMLLFNNGFSHVGIYDGNGYVIEAKGHAYGVVRSVYAASNWKYYGECKYFDYNTDTKPEALTSVRRGDKVYLKDSATIYGTNKRFADFVYNIPLYVLEQNKGRVVFSISKGGDVTGATNIKYLYKK